MLDEDRRFFHPADPPVIELTRGNQSAIADDLDFIKRQLAQLPTRNEV